MRIMVWELEYFTEKEDFWFTRLARRTLQASLKDDVALGDFRQFCSWAEENQCKSECADKKKKPNNLIPHAAFVVK